MAASACAGAFGLPGPRAMRLVGARGNLVAFMRNPVAHLQRLHRTYGDIVALARGSTDYVFVFGPEYNQRVLTDTDLFAAPDASASPLAAPRGSPLARLSAGLTQMNGYQHRRHRQLMHPAFTRRRLENLQGDIAELAASAVAGWPAGVPLDVLGAMRELTLAIAIKTLIGLDPRRDGRRVNDLLAHWMALVFSLSALVLPIPVPGTPYRRLLRLSEELEAEIAAMIRRRRAIGGAEDDVLSLLMHARDEAGTGLTDTELVAQTATLFVAGHEITARALTWTVLLLALHPGVLSALQDEVAERLGDARPTAALLTQTPLLDAVLKESLRLLPPIMWWTRITSRACDLGPYRLPRGARIVFSPFVTHRCATVYPEPERFLPERWFAQEPPPYAFIPFSGGPRICLGAAHAMLEMKLVLTVMLQRVRLELLPDTRVDRGGLLLLEPRGGMPMRVCVPGRPSNRVDVRGQIRELIKLPDEGAHVRQPDV